MRHFEAAVLLTIGKNVEVGATSDFFAGVALTATSSPLHAFKKMPVENKAAVFAAWWIIVRLESFVFIAYCFRNGYYRAENKPAKLDSYLSLSRSALTSNCGVTKISAMFEATERLPAKSYARI
jgi:hypothetical protein